MITQTIIYAIFKYLHLIAMATLVGGALILRYVVLPTRARAQSGGDAFEGMHRVLLWLFGSAAVIALLSGLVNTARAFSVAPMPPVHYHMILGVKMLLALVLFATAILAVLPQARWVAQQKLWIGFTSHLGLLLVALSVAMRFLSGK